MNARVRAARAVYDHVSLIEQREDSRQLGLNGAAIRLYLPAVIIRPVILYFDLDVSHSDGYGLREPGFIISQPGLCDPGGRAGNPRGHMQGPLK